MALQEVADKPEPHVQTGPHILSDAGECEAVGNDDPEKFVEKTRLMVLVEDTASEALCRVAGRRAFDKDVHDQTTGAGPR